MRLVEADRLGAAASAGGGDVAQLRVEVVLIGVDLAEFALVEILRRGSEVAVGQQVPERATALFEAVEGFAQRLGGFVAHLIGAGVVAPVLLPLLTDAAAFVVITVPVGAAVRLVFCHILVGGDRLGEFGDLVHAFDDPFIELAEVAGGGGFAGADEFPDFPAFLGIEFDTALEALDCFLLDLRDLGAGCLGVPQAGEHLDEFIDAFLDTGIQFRDVLGPFGEAGLALGDVGFEGGDGFAAGRDFLRRQTGGRRLVLRVKAGEGGQGQHAGGFHEF